MKEIKYTFLPVLNCNMCGADSSQFDTLGKRLNQSQGLRPRKKTGITTIVVKCKNCRLVFSNPQPIPESIEDHYEISPEEYWGKEFLIVEDDYMAQVINKLKTLLHYTPGMRSLDIGAGFGRSMRAMSKFGFDAYGIEPSETFYNMAIEKLKISTDKLLRASVEKSEYEENYFDFILFNAVLEHFQNPSASIKKAIKWLKPGGLVLIVVPSSDWLISKLFNFYFKIIGTDYVSNISPMHKPYHLYEFSLKSFEKHKALIGYDIEEYEYSVCSTFMPKLFDFILKPYMNRTNTGMEIRLWLRKPNSKPGGGDSLNT